MTSSLARNSLWCVREGSGYGRRKCYLSPTGEQRSGISESAFGDSGRIFPPIQVP